MAKRAGFNTKITPGAQEILIFQSPCCFAYQKSSPTSSRKQDAFSAFQNLIPSRSFSRFLMLGLLLSSGISMYSLICAQAMDNQTIAQQAESCFQDVQEGHYQASITTCKRLTASIPESPEGWTALAYGYMQLNQTSDAVNAYEKALHYALEKYTDLGDPLQLKEKALAYNNLGFAYVVQGDYPRGIQAFQDARDLTPNNSALLLNLGLAYTKSKQFSKAIEALQEAHTLSPSSAVILARLGDAYTQTGQYTLGITAYQDAVQINPNDPISLENLGILHQRKMNYVASADCLTKSIAADPNRWEPYHFRAFSLLKMGKYEEAIDSVKAALVLNPNESESWMLLGVLTEHQEKWEEALTAYQKALVLNGDTSNIPNSDYMIAKKAMSRMLQKMVQQKMNAQEV
jgi:tetratricopeptide (TPR) repeat protein